MANERKKYTHLSKLNYERQSKQPIIDDKLVISAFVIEIIWRAVQDQYGQSLSLNGGTKAQNKANIVRGLKSDSTIFLKSEYCEWLCDTVGLDANAVLYNLKKRIEFEIDFKSRRKQTFTVKKELKKNEQRV